MTLHSTMINRPSAHTHAAHSPAGAPVALGRERRGRLQCGDAVTSSAIDPVLHTPPARGLDHAPTRSPRPIQRAQELGLLLAEPRPTRPGSRTRSRTDVIDAAALRSAGRVLLR
ncbi:hypothetical protein VPH35_016587 [Triticum aestivum]